MWVVPGWHRAPVTSPAPLRLRFSVAGWSAARADTTRRSKGTWTPSIWAAGERAHLKSTGYFDDELVRNQDDELSLRIIRQGGRIWQSPNIRSCYQPRKSLVALLRQYTPYGYWKVRVIQKHRLPASWRHLIPAALLLALISLGALAMFSKWALLLWLCVFGASWCFICHFGGFPCAGRRDPVPMLPFVVACYHFGYGYGFWRGVWDFILCRKAARRSFATLTRCS